MSPREQKPSMTTAASLILLVGATGFEPATPCAQGRCATRLRYAPTPANSIRFRAPRASAEETDRAAARHRTPGRHARRARLPVVVVAADDAHEPEHVIVDRVRAVHADDE